MADNDFQKGINGLKKKIPVNDLGTLVALVLLCVIMSILSPRFFMLANFKNIFVQISIISIIAVGMTFVILTGGIDLSVGSTVAFCGLMLGTCIVNLKMPILPALLIAITAGTLVGFVNGILISKLNLPPFIATLGMMSIVRGAAFSITGGQPVYTYPKAFLSIAGNVFGIPIPIIIMAVIFAAALYLLKYTKLGRYSYSIGGNEAASKLSGINVPLYKTAVYTILGFLCSISSIILVARLDSAVPVAGDGYELDAIAAVVIGGTSMMGGEGKIWGTIIGSLIMGVVSNGLNLLATPQGMQRMIKGAIIIVAVLVDVFRKRSRV
ncbi:MAG: ribose ABC transporter permease [Treponema sp.]|nr:ribose ABC transporter permease [Treponema sp.]